MSGDSDLQKRREQAKEQVRESKRIQSKKQGRLIAEENNPCLKEYQLSFKCMNDNNYEENKCDLYFDNYKNCKQFWLWVQRDRRMKGIRPELPPLAEREKIKEERKNEFLKILR